MVTQGLPVFVNMTGFWVCVGMQLWKDSEYSRIPNMPVVCICKRSEYAWILLNNAWINCSDCESSEVHWFYWVLNMSLVLNARARNRARLWICEDYTGCWICLSKSEFTFNMYEYAFTMLDMLEYAWINLNEQSSEYARVVSDAVHSIRPLYKWLSSYRDRLIQNTVNHLRWSVYKKKTMPEHRHATKKFSGQREVWWNYGTSINILSKTQEKKTHREIFWSFFS